MKQLPLLATLAGALVLLAHPATGQPRQDAPSGAPASAPVKDCDAQARAKKLSGIARDTFMPECLGGKPAERPKPGSALDGAANLQNKEAQDAQFRKWNSAADRAMRSICAGCSQGAAVGRPRKVKARPKPPPDDDGLEVERGTNGADD
jgi:hypothetical protein